LFSEGHRFESHPQQRINWWRFFVIFLRFPTLIPAYCLLCSSPACLQILPVQYSPLILPCNNILLALSNKRPYPLTILSSLILTAYSTAHAASCPVLSCPRQTCQQTDIHTQTHTHTHQHPDSHSYLKPLFVFLLSPHSAKWPQPWNILHLYLISNPLSSNLTLISVSLCLCIQGMPHSRNRNNLGHCEGCAACKAHKMERFLMCLRDIEALAASSNVFT